MPTQAELAGRLADEMECAGDYDPSVLDLLDDLACAGLKLAEDNQGIAAREYHSSMIRIIRFPRTEHIHLNLTSEAETVLRDSGVTESELLDVIHWEEVARAALEAYPRALATHPNRDDDDFVARLSTPLADGEIEANLDRLGDWIHQLRVHGALARLLEIGDVAARWDDEIQDWRLVTTTHIQDADDD